MASLGIVSNIAGCVSFAFDIYTHFDRGASDTQNEFNGELNSLQKVLSSLLDGKPDTCQVDPTVLDTLRSEVTKCMAEIDSFRKNMDSGRGRLRGLLLGTLRKNTLEFSQKMERRKSFFTLTLMIVIMERLDRPAHTTEDKNPHQNIKNIEHTSPDVPRNERTSRTDPNAYKPTGPTVPEGIWKCAPCGRRHERMQKETCWGRLLRKFRRRWTQNRESKKQHSNRGHHYACDSCEVKSGISRRPMHMDRI